MKPKAYSYIRFSRPEQLKGDSLRRQLEASEKYALEKGLIFDTSLDMQDLGKSAFHGVHKTKGALGIFLKLVEDGKIPIGSFLIVENLDRLSREQVLDALNQFTSIIQAGITLVTLQDNMSYSKESITDNWSQLIISITYMAKAYKESKDKSDRLLDAWENKRKEAINGNQKLTAKAPLWLRLSDDRKEYILIPKACKVVELIYRMKLSGKGLDTIEKELNQMPDVWTPPYNQKRKTQGWRKSYISKILSTRAVIGEFTPTRKGIPEQPIEDYFPKAITNELFYNVQDLIRHNREVKGQSGGQTGKAGNLFVQVVRCGLCKAPMHYIDKGKSSKGGTYLHCDYSRRKVISNPCNAKAIRYDEFEHLFFNNFEELNVCELLPNKDEIIIQINDLQRKQVANKQQLIEIEGQIENLTYKIQTTRDQRVSDLLDKQLIKILDEQASVYNWNNVITKQLEASLVESDNIRHNLDTAREVYQLMQDCQDDSEKITLRLKLRVEIRKLIKSIEIYPLQEDYTALQEVEPGIYQTMNSRYIDKVRIKFNGSENMRVLYLKKLGEVY